MKPLFAYGTLRRTERRRALLGEDYAAEPATLAGWERVALPGGYLSLRQRRGGLVRGSLVALDAAGWAIADAWEEVPSYRRVEVRVATARGPVRAQTYVRPAFDAPAVEDDDRDAALDDAAVDAAIARFEPAAAALRAALQTAGSTRPKP
ncbi:MAG: gamma-glutamylcyclotransferase family protein [Vulcanimicrobiaceae bacterium]|jgi:gamma-glutamylcyclotransferase (GGCT)/AIG2-like uncharacterized protein YtfP